MPKVREQNQEQSTSLHWYQQIKYLDKNKYNTFPNKTMNPIKIYPHRWLKYFNIARFPITHTDLYIKCIFKHLSKNIFYQYCQINSKIPMDERKYTTCCKATGVQKLQIRKKS